jgi:protein phosphatase
VQTPFLHFLLENGQGIAEHGDERGSRANHRLSVKGGWIMASDAADTQDYEIAPGPGRQPPKLHSSMVQADIAGRSHPGRVRPNNEDHFLVVCFGRFLEALQTNLPADQVPSQFEDHGYGLVVADGMGGPAAGEEASRLAITRLVNLVLTTPDWILRAEDPAFADEVMRRAVERFEHVNQALTEEAELDPELRGFGTTMTLAANMGRNLFIAHIGDSRAYVFRREKLHQLTRDHTLVRELYEAGLITLAQVATHHLRHVITRHLGAVNGAKADVQKWTLEDGDRLLLCSDGLTEMVTRELIAAILAEGATSEAMCEKLVDQALAAGGKDNVTAIVA